MNIVCVPLDSIFHLIATFKNKCCQCLCLTCFPFPLLEGRREELGMLFH